MLNFSVLVHLFIWCSNLWQAYTELWQHSCFSIFCSFWANHPDYLCDTRNQNPHRNKEKLSKAQNNYTPTRKGWSWLGKHINQTIPTHQSKKESTDTGTEERKIQVAQLGIEPRASRFAHECSNHWAIVPQLQTTLNKSTLHIANVNATLLGDCNAAIYSQQRPTP